MREIGKLDWAFSGGKIPMQFTGSTLDFISHDKIAILNTSSNDIDVDLHIFFENDPPIGPFEFKIKAQRVLKIKMNELINPFPIELEKNYSCYIKCSRKVVIQFSRMNTKQDKNAEMSTMAYPISE